MKSNGYSKICDTFFCSRNFFICDSFDSYCTIIVKWLGNRNSRFWLDLQRCWICFESDKYRGIYLGFMLWRFFSLFCLIVGVVCLYFPNRYFFVYFLSKHFQNCALIWNYDLLLLKHWCEFKIKNWNCLRISVIFFTNFTINRLSFFFRISKWRATIKYINASYFFLTTRWFNQIQNVIAKVCSVSLFEIFFNIFVILSFF